MRARLLGQPCAGPWDFSPLAGCARPQVFSPLAVCTRPQVSLMGSPVPGCRVSLLGQPCARPQGFSPRLALFDTCCFPLEMFHVLLTPAFWDLDCCFGFTLAVHTTLTRTLPLGTLPSQGCMQGSWPCRALPSSMSFLSNLGGSFHDSAPLVFYVPVKLASCG